MTSALLTSVTFPENESAAKAGKRPAPKITRTTNSAIAHFFRMITSMYYLGPCVLVCGGAWLGFEAFNRSVPFGPLLSLRKATPFDARSQDICNDYSDRLVP